jgi:hypothetical protein
MKKLTALLATACISTFLHAQTPQQDTQEISIQLMNKTQTVLDTVFTISKDTDVVQFLRSKGIYLETTVPQLTKVEVIAESEKVVNNANITYKNFDITDYLETKNISLQQLQAMNNEQLGQFAEEMFMAVSAAMANGRSTKTNVSKHVVVKEITE